MHKAIRRSLCLVLGLALIGARAELAQEPVLNRPRPVPPNLMLLIDNSGSMMSNLIYEYGNPTAYGPKGPFTGGSLPIAFQPASASPDVNRLAYDPRVRYARRVGAGGQPLANPGPDRTAWTVYFSRIGSGPYVTGDSRWADPANYHTPVYWPPSSEVVAGSASGYPSSVNTSTIPASTLFPRFRQRTDCTALPTACTLDEERANYSNWYYWYSRRIDVVKTGLAQALTEVSDDAIRIGLATFDELTATSNHTPQVSRGVSSLNTATRAAIENWIASFPAIGDTPSRGALYKVGQYFERADSDGPWATVPNPDSRELKVMTSGPMDKEGPLKHASCRRSYVMLFTDGYWNDPTSGPNKPQTVGNVDGTAFTVDRGPEEKPYVYVPGAPFTDTYSDTLADVAMHLWSRDLRPDLSNRVPQVSRPYNPSTWQNLTLYTVSLGLSGSLPQNTTTLAELTNGKPWPQPVPDKPTTVDDLWHASINGHGEHIRAQNSSEVTAAFRRILGSVRGAPQTLSGVAVSSAYLRSGTRKYKPQYVPGEWSGMLSAIELDAATGNEKSPPIIHWQVESGTTPTGDPISTVPEAATRNVVTWDGTRGTTFTSANTGLDASLVAYVRGDASLEVRNGGSFRNRTARLGDIVNSNPVFVKDGVDRHYETLQGSFGDYRAFVASKAARTEGVVFIGANDGMLHGFRDSNGVETFAFVPRAVYPNLPRLADDPYVHRYFVDGPLVETDAYLGGSWKNVLLGTAGAGAKSVFALDVTDPLGMTANSVMWEVNSSTPGFANLGLVTGEVLAGVTRSGHWVAVFGNGFDSSSGAASLFVVDLADGHLIREITIPASFGSGLTAARAVYDDARRLIGVYGGDLKGQLWKFDLTGSPGSWHVGVSGHPLFDAGAAHPITAAPAVAPHPKGGYVVVFGTGKLTEISDTTPPFVPQRTYGVWDSVPFGAGEGTAAQLSSLVRQTIEEVTVGTPPVSFYEVSTNTVPYGDGQTGVRGWYIDLDSGVGQRVIYPVDRVSASFVLLSTMSPVSPTPADICEPTGSGQGWVYLINALTGSGPERQAFDTNHDGIISSSDVVVAGYRDAVDGRPTPIDVGSSRAVDKVCVETADAICTRIELTCGQAGARACPTGSASGLKTRQWRQIFLR